jgi:hypothetical protein
MALPQGNTTGKKPGAGDEEATANGVSLETYRNDVNAAQQTGHTAGLAEGATAERTRISAILGSDEAKDKPKAAMSVAMKTGMSLEDAKAFLADMPTEKAEAAAVEQKPAAGKVQGRNHFAEAMNSSQHPEVGSDDDQANGGGGEPTSEDKAKNILAAFGGETGYGPKKKSA